MEPKLVDAINVQISDEFASAHLYLSMAAHCEYEGLPGFANWMRKQYEEELAHGLRLFDYLVSRQMKPIVFSIETPEKNFGNPEELFKDVLRNEEHVTILIHELYERAVKENDHALQIELQWFITEQVEEEKSAWDVLESIRLIDGNKEGLLLIDRELAQR